MLYGVPVDKPSWAVWKAGGVQKGTLCRSDYMTKMNHEAFFFFLFMETISI
jgi:hypothetical protein